MRKLIATVFNYSLDEPYIERIPRPTLEGRADEFASVRLAQDPCCLERTPRTAPRH